MELDELKTTYAPYICEIVSEMMEVGATLDDVIKVLRIDNDTLINWRNCYPELDTAIKEGLIESAAWVSLEGKGAFK